MATYLRDHGLRYFESGVQVKKKNKSGPTKPQADRAGVRVDLRLPEELIEKVDKLRKERTRTKFIRDAVAYYVDPM